MPARRLILAIVLLSAGLAATAARAEDGAPEARLSLEGDGLAPDPVLQAPAPDPWRFDFALYLWMADLSGTMTVGPVSGEFGADFSDLADKLNGAATLHAEGWRNDRIGVMVDLNWMSFNNSKTRDTALGTVEGEADVDMMFLEGALAGGIREGDLSLDFFAGVRVIALKTEIDLGALGHEKDDSWLFDPMLGMRVGWTISPSFIFSLRVDVAGFGVGTEMTGNVAGYVAYRFSTTFALLAGWRSMGMEVEDGRRSADVRMSGPVLGFDVGF